MNKIKSRLTCFSVVVVSFFLFSFFSIHFELSTFKYLNKWLNIESEQNGPQDLIEVFQTKVQLGQTKRRLRR